MITPYVSQQPVDDFSLRFANLIYSATLTASTAATLTIPGTAPHYKMVVKTSAETWMSYNSTPALPAAPTGGALNVSTSEMVNAGYVVCREVNRNDIVHFISASASDVSVSLFSLKTNN